MLVDKEGNPTPDYLAYQQYQQAYEDKVQAYNRAWAEATADPVKLQRWPIDGMAYHAAVDAALVCS